MDKELLETTEKVAAFIAQPESTEEAFNTLALEVFACQYRLIELYRKLCRRRQRTPETVHSWREIPSVPADVFKHFSLFAGAQADQVQTFRSSGTTQPGQTSQAHFSEVGLALMNRAIEANARRMLFPDGDQRRIRILVLAPSPETAPHVIMINGMAHLMRCFGAEGSRFFVGPNGLETRALLDELTKCIQGNIPVALMGSSFGFVHLFDEMERRGRKLVLPEESRLMDAGGYKGRNREIERTAFVSWVTAMLGLWPERVVNLLGMTELASQIYDGVLWRSATRRETAPPRMKEPPHWVRTEVVDPTRLRNGEMEVIPDADRVGLLRHLDLANLERPMVIQSEDIGIRRESGFEVIQRIKGAEPRGCSLTMEQFAARAVKSTHGRRRQAG